MPETGSCSDSACNQEIKALYECHCCSRFICLNHLIEHVEIAKQYKEQLNSFRNELIPVTTTLKLIIEQKRLDIEREKYLLEQANHFLDKPVCSMDEIQDICDQINQAIVSNRTEEIILQVNSSLSETKNCSCICQCDKKKTNRSYPSSLRNTRSKSKSSLRLNSITDTDLVEITGIQKNNESSTCIEHDSIDTALLDETEKSIKDSYEDEEQNKLETKGTSNYYGHCPLTFDGAYGLTQEKHSISLCSSSKVRRVGLFGHFTGKHELKAAYARRLIRAVINNKDPMITKLFDEKEDVINHFYKISCPFHKGMIDLSGYSKKPILNVPCRYRSIIFSSLKYHLKFYHNVSGDLAGTLVACFNEVRKQK